MSGQLFKTLSRLSQGNAFQPRAYSPQEDHQGLHSRTSTGLGYGIYAVKHQLAALNKNNFKLYIPIVPCETDTHVFIFDATYLLPRTLFHW